MDTDIVTPDDSGQVTPDDGTTGQDTQQTDQPAAEVQPAPVVPSQPIDPLQWLDTAKDLKPEVKEALKAGFLRQADYTKKTQEIAALRRKAELFDQTQQVPKQVPQPKTEEDQIPDDPKSFMEMTINKAVERAVEQARSEWRADRDLELAERLDPRLSSDEEYATEIARIVSTNPQYRGGEMNLVEATKHAIAEYKTKTEKVRQAVISELNEKAKKTTVIPSESGSPLSTANKGQVRTMLDAARLAEEELSR